MNCLAIEVGGEILVVDCGVTFPRSELGIDTYRPDLSFLEERRDAVRGLVLTHGHEDHIGAVHAFVDRFDVPVWGPPYALDLVRLRLNEHGFRPGTYDLRPARPRGRFAVGKFEVEPVSVTHSIVDSLALVIRSSAGTAVHTGDFKLDPTPLTGNATDEERLREVGDEGVRLLLSDSTNVDSVGHTSSEAEAAHVLRGLIEGHSGRVIVGMFASNVARLNAIGEIAAAVGRKVILLGRSVQTHSKLGRDHGYIRWMTDLVVPPEEASRLPRQKQLVIVTGTQGERVAVLWRLATRTHPHLSLDEGDRVIFSSRVIPGNEPAVVQITNGFLRHGVEVCSATTSPGVHVSGHAYQDEQARMIDLLQPRGFLPIHGTLMHLHRHASLARAQGVGEVAVLENGEVGELSEVDPFQKLTERAQVGKVATWSGEDIPERVLLDREALARAGVVFVTVLAGQRGQPAGPVALSTRGVIDELLEGEVLREAAREAHRVLSERTYPRERPSDEEIAEVARTSVRRKLEVSLGKRPMVVAQVIRVR